MDPLIWVIDDEDSIRFVFDRALNSNGISHRTFKSGDEALEALKTEIPDVIVSDINMPGTQTDGLTLITKVHEVDPNIPVIIITANSDLSSAVSSYEHGTFEYLPKPFDIEEAMSLIRRAAVHRVSLDNRKKDKAQQNAGATHSDNDDVEIIGKSPAMQDVFKFIGRVSKADVPVFIFGESGTGRELVAKALHNHSERRGKGDFVAVNIASIPKESIEFELFSNDLGPCAIERAQGGTLFINEIGEMPMEAQTRLLTVLQNKEYLPLGQSTPCKADVRVIVSSSQNLETLNKEGKFIPDLYYRLNVIHINMPPLRDRNNDIPMLANHFLAQAALENNTEPKKLTSEVLVFLCRQPWPGNVRQLKNLCKCLTIMVTGRDIQMSDLPSEYSQARNQQPKATTSIAGTSKEPTSWQEQLRNWVDGRLRAGEHDILSEATPEFERVMLEAALAFTANHKQESAKLLGWGRNTLTRKLKELNIHP